MSFRWDVGVICFRTIYMSALNNFEKCLVFLKEKKSWWGKWGGGGWPTFWEPIEFRTEFLLEIVGNRGVWWGMWEGRGCAREKATSWSLDGVFLGLGAGKSKGASGLTIGGRPALLFFAGAGTGFGHPGKYLKIRSHGLCIQWELNLHCLYNSFLNVRSICLIN